MGCSKRSSKREIHNDMGLPQERNKKSSNKPSNLPLTEPEKERQINASLLEGRK